MRKLMIICIGNQSSSTEMRKINLDGQYIWDGVFETTKEIEINDNSHTLVSVSSNGIEDSVRIDEGKKDCTVELRILENSSLFVIRESSIGVKTYKLNRSNAKNAPKENQTPSIVFAVVVMIILTIVGLILFVSGECSLFGLIVGLICSSIATAMIIIGGVWVLIIPLPFIYLFKSGTTKPDLKVSVKILTFTGMIVFIILSIVSFTSL